MAAVCKLTIELHPTLDKPDAQATNATDPTIHADAYADAIATLCELESANEDALIATLGGCSGDCDVFIGRVIGVLVTSEGITVVGVKVLGLFLAGRVGLIDGDLVSFTNGTVDSEGVLGDIVGSLVGMLYARGIGLLVTFKEEGFFVE